MIPTQIVQVWDETGANPLTVLQGASTRTISDVFCDLGSMQIEFPKDIAGAEPLLVDADRQLRVLMASCDPMWFLLDEDSYTNVSDDPATEPLTITCRSLAGLLDEAVVLPFGGIGSGPAEYTFTNPTPGEIIETLFDQAQTAGWLQNITLSGSATLDAAGAAWPDTLDSATYRAGTTLLSVLKGLSDAQLVEWRFVDRELQIHVPGGELDRTLDYVLRPAQNLLAAPLQRSRRAVATDVLVEGTAGETALRTQSLTGRRRRAAYVSQSNADPGALDQIGDLYLDAHAEADVQITHELADGDGAPVPWRDYRPGDRIGTVAGGGGVSVRRIAQIALKIDDSGAGVTLEVGSILRTAEEKFARQLSKLLPGEGSFT